MKINIITNNKIVTPKNFIPKSEVRLRYIYSDDYYKNKSFNPLHKRIEFATSLNINYKCILVDNVSNDIARVNFIFEDGGIYEGFFCIGYSNTFELEYK